MKNIVPVEVAYNGKIGELFCDFESLFYLVNMLENNDNVIAYKLIGFSKTEFSFGYIMNKNVIKFTPDILAAT